MIKYLIIAIICVIGIDYLHFDEVVTSKIKSILTKGRLSEPFELKPFTCSLCLSWWINLALLIITQEITLAMVLYILTISICTPYMSATLTTIDNIINNLFRKINEKIDR